MRALGALFAGSAVMFTTAALHGDPLLLAGDEVGSITEPAASPPGSGQGTFGASPPARVSGPGQATEWTRDAAPRWGSSLGDLPVRRAPVQEAPRRAAPTAAGSAEAVPVAPAASGRSAAPPAASDQAPIGRASTDNAEPGKPDPQTADPQRAGGVDGLLGGVFGVGDGLSR
jgi:hypothetical protein